MKHLEMIGLCRSGDPRFMANWERICREGHAREVEWVSELKKKGVSASHPDDGWVDRKRNEVNLVYPHFNSGVRMGDEIALGCPEEYRIVTVVGIRHGVVGGVYYQFDWD